MEWKSHPGECCGRSYIYDMEDGPTEYLVSRLKILLYHNDEAPDCGKECVEIVLTEEQAFNKSYKNRDWNSWLTRTFGFRKVMRWINPNSGNVCISYMRSGAEIK